MPVKRTKYFVLPATAPSTGINYTDFDLALGAVSLSGQEVTFVGSAGVDSIFVRPGVSVDFVLSGSGSDAVYLPGRFSDYSVALSGTNMTVQRGTEATLEKVSFTKAVNESASDRLIFADGTVNSLALYNSLKPANPVPLSAISGETSLAPISSGALDATIKAFALGDSGDTFVPAKSGIQMILVGSVSADTVYVADGTNIDATLLGSGKDSIYMRGNWSDYTKVVSGSYITFTRSVNGSTETVKVTGGSSGLNDQLVFADGAAGSLAAKNALVAAVAAGSSTGSVALSALSDYDSTLRTPGLGLGPSASALDNVTNLDVSSNIVLSFPEAVTAVTGKAVHIVNTGGSGFRGESATNTLDIAVDSTSQVQIVGSRVIINPAVDLDFTNNYYIAIDAGAFKTASGKLSDSFEGVSTLNFSTVAPGVTSSNLPSVDNAAASVAMADDGTLKASFSYLDIESVGNPAAGAPTPIDVSSTNVALVFRDYDSAGPNPALGYDGVRTGNFNVAVNNFGVGDRVYVDNQSSNPNNLALSAFSNGGRAPTTIQFAGTDLGGFIVLTAAGSAAGFDSAGKLKEALAGITYDPVVSDGMASIAVDATPPVIGAPSSVSIAENSTKVVTLGADEAVTWSIAPVAGTVSADSKLFKIDGSSTLAFISSPNFEQAGRSSVYSVSVTATDLTGNSSSKDILVNVTDVNEAPVSVGTVGTQTAVVGQAFSLSLAGKIADPDGGATANGTLSYSLSGTLPAGLSFSAANQSITGTPSAGAAATTFTLKATDGGSPALSATQTFTLGVASDVVVTGFTVSDSNGSTTVGKGGDSLTFKVSTSESVTVSTAGGVPTATFAVGGVSVVAQYSAGSGSSTLTFVGSAPTGASGTFQLSSLSLNNGTITGSGTRSLVTSVVGQTFSGYTLDNLAPSLTNASPIKVDENATAVATLSASESVTYSTLGTTGDAALFNLSNGILTFKTGQNFEQTSRSNTYSVPITMTDAAGNAATRTLSIELQDVNESLVSDVSDRNTAANSVKENSPVGTPVGYTAFASDLDGTNNKVTYKLVADATGADYTGKELRIEGTTGVISVGGPIDYEALSSGKNLTVYVKATSADGSSKVSAAVPIAVTDDTAETVPIVLSSQPVISPTTTTISGSTVANATVKVYVGSSTTISNTVTADSTGAWSMPVSTLKGLISGSNPVKFTATSGSSTGELTQSFLYTGAPSWTQDSLKVQLIRGTVDQALASDGKITHTEAVGILNAAIDAAKAANGAGGTVGASVLADLRAVSLRGDSVFSSPDLTGKESGYLSYVFDKVVNTSAANAFFTGGTTTKSALGNLNANSPISDLEKLRDKWLLGLDLPDPRTQGDTANPSATAASGVYKSFNGILVDAGGFNTTDVQQGSAGTCYLLSSAAFVAETETYAKASGLASIASYKTAFEQVFTTNGGSAPSWGVRFLDMYGKAHWVTVNNKLAAQSATATSPLYAKPAVSASGSSELWMPLLEKAYAQANEIGIFGRDASDNAYFAIEGGLAEPVTSLVGGGVSFFDTALAAYKPNFYTTVDASAPSRLAALTQELNTGESLFMASWRSSTTAGAYTFVSGHAFMVYDAARGTSNNSTVSIYNPWGPSTSGSWLSPFASDLSQLYNDSNILLLFHTTSVPAEVTASWAANAAKKAASASVASVASEIRAAIAGSDTMAAGVIDKPFLAIAPGAASAFSDNSTPSIEDDRQGLFSLSANQAGAKVVMLSKASGSSANLADLKAAIIGATTVAAFDSAVVAARNQGVTVHFGLQLPSSVDITGDATPELGVTVGLQYPTATPSGTITFTPLNGSGEVAAAKVLNGAASGVKNVTLSTVGHAVSFDSNTQAVLYLDAQGYWKAGKFGEAVSSYSYLTWDADGDATPDKINSDTFEVTAQHLQAIYDGSTLTGYELVAQSNENPDDIFTLYFSATGTLISSEYLSDAEILEAEAEYGYDVNDSGALGTESVFIAEGVDAPDLYANEYGDLVLVNGDGVEIPILLDGEAVNIYDFEDDVEPVLVLSDKSNASQFLVYIQFADDDIAAITVRANGEILLDNAGDIVFTELTAAVEADIEKVAGIDLGRDGDTVAQSPLITGDAGDNTFDTRGDGTADRFKDSSGDDTYFGGEYDDLLIGILSGESNFANRGSNTFYGGEGNDRYAGLGDGDVFFGGSGDNDVVWVNGSSAAYQIVAATPEQMAFAQAIAEGAGETVTTGYIIKELASGALSAVFDVERIEFALDGQVRDLSTGLVIA